MTDQTPFQILAEWAWTKVNLKTLQAMGAGEQEISAAIVAYRHALRKKKALDAANPDMPQTQQHELAL